MNGLQIGGILLLALGLIMAVVGFVFLKKDMMDPKGALIIAGLGILNVLVSIGLISWGAYQNHQAQMIRQQEIIMAHRKAQVKKEMEKKKKAEEEHKRLMGKTDNSSEIAMRQLTSAQYAMTPNTIYRMYNSQGQNFFDAQYDTGEAKNYALKHIGLTLPGLTFKTTTNQTARVDNLKGDNKKVMLFLLNIQHDPRNKQVITNSSDIDSELRLIQGMAMNYPDVSFIIAFPNDDRTTWNAFLKTVSGTIQAQYQNYKLMVLGSDNNNVGSNYGGLANFAQKTLNWNGKNTLIAIDKHDRVALTQYGSFTSGNSSADGQTILTRTVNLAFTSNDAQKVYNMLKPDSQIQEIQQAGNQGLTNDTIDGKTKQSKAPVAPDGDDDD